MYKLKSKHIHKPSSHKRSNSLNSCLNQWPSWWLNQYEVEVIHRQKLQAKQSKFLLSLNSLILLLKQSNFVMPFSTEIDDVPIVQFFVLELRVSWCWWCSLFFIKQTRIEAVVAYTQSKSWLRLRSSASTHPEIKMERDRMVKELWRKKWLAKLF